jgi:hypothetical protein
MLRGRDCLRGHPLHSVGGPAPPIRSRLTIWSRPKCIVDGVTPDVRSYFFWLIWVKGDPAHDVAGEVQGIDVTARLIGQSLRMAHAVEPT